MQRGMMKKGIHIDFKNRLKEFESVVRAKTSPQEYQPGNSRQKDNGINRPIRLWQIDVHPLHQPNE
jgi:hypothetical protein